MKGTIPASLSALPLRYFVVEGNQLHGPLPDLNWDGMYCKLFLDRPVVRRSILRPHYSPHDAEIRAARSRRSII